MVTLKLDKLFNILAEIPDVHDMIIKDKILCIKTDSNDYVKADLSLLDATENVEGVEINYITDNMTLTDFAVKYKVIKVLSDNFQVPVEYDEDEEKVAFFMPKTSYVSRIPIINNNYSLDTWNELFEGEHLGDITLPKNEFLKIKTVLDTYKAYPYLEIKDDKVYIVATTASKQDSTDFLVSETNIFANENISETIKLQRILFTYSFDGDVTLSFYKNADGNLTVNSKGEIKGVAVEYAFKTTLNDANFDDIDISNINLNVF